MEEKEMTFKGSRLIDKLMLAYIRKIPNHPFKIRIINNLNDLFFDNSIKITCENDTNFHFSSREQMGEGILHNDEYEPLTLKMCKHSLKDGGVFVDIGANIGLFSIYLSKAPGVVVYSIEPSVQNFQKFLDHLKINDCDNINPINIGLSYEDSFGYMVNQSPKNSGTTKVVEKSSEKETYMIRLCTLADIIKQFDIKDIQLLKIDVEGYEMNVFKGLFNERNTVIPKNIVMEFTDQIERTGYNLQDSFNYFIDIGYKAFDVTGRPYTFGDPLIEANLWFKHGL